MLGKPVVNFNYTAGAEALRSAAGQCGIRKVLTSRAFLEKFPVEPPGEAVAFGEPHQIASLGTPANPVGFSQESQARGQAEEILTEARRVAESQKKRLRDELEADRQRRLEDTTRLIEAETQRALGLIRAEVAELTVIATQKVTGKVLDDADHRRLIEDAIKELDFSLGKLRYLSDMEWEAIERHDYLATSTAKADRFYDPRKDTSFLGPLRLGTKTYSKGLALKSHTKLTYRLLGNHPSPLGFFATVFLNGKLKSYFNPTERPRESFFQEFYDTPNDWDVQVIGEWENGDSAAFNQMYNYFRTTDFTALAGYQGGAAPRARASSRTATRAEDIGRAYGVHTRHDAVPDRFDRTATRHTVTLTGDRAVLELLAPDLRAIGIRPHITDTTHTPGRGRRPAHT